MDWVQYALTVKTDVEKEHDDAQAQARLMQTRIQVETVLNETERKIELLNIRVRESLTRSSERQIEKKVNEIKMLCKRADRLRDAVSICA